MIRSSFDEQIKQNAMTIKEFVEMDFGNTVDFDGEPKFYNPYKDIHYDDRSQVLFDVELKDIAHDEIPDWVYNEEYTEEEKEKLSELYDELFFSLEQEYCSEWDEKVQAYYDSKYEKAEEELDTDERWQEYLDEKETYESRRDSFYGHCMNGGGGKEAFRRCYGSGDFDTYGEWLAEKYG